MSRLQTAAKPILLPLIKGDPLLLNREDQRLFAAWCAMSTMTSDFFYPKKQAISQADRDWLHHRWEPPPETWKVWIGRFARDKWQPHWIKNSLPMIDEPEEGGEEGFIESSRDSVRPPNTQTTTMVVGELYIHTFSCPYSRTIGPINMIPANGGEKVPLIWPPREHFIAWPIAPLSDKEADGIPGSIFNLLVQADRDRRK
jgi:hypothetical protein